MKKSLLALAVLGAFTGVASAQSSVTIWGVVDLSANDIKNGDAHTQSLASNQLNSNRLGFRGIEDMGGGLKAGFWLEAGMNNATGYAGGGSGNVSNTDTASGQLFNRRSTVSLINPMGELRLGRDYDPSFWNTVFFDVNGANGLGQGLNLISSLGSGATTIARTNNSIGYFLPPNLGGFYGQAQVAAGQGTNANKYYGGRLGFAAGPIDVAVGYGLTKTQSVGGGNLTPENFKMANIGGSYDFGVAKILAYFNRNTWGVRKQNVYEVSAGIPLGQGELRAVYGHADGSGGGTDGDDANLYSVEYVYNLSKRTALYTTAAQIRNKGAAAFTVLGGTVASNLAGNKSTGFNVGVRHSF
jgi:predicted porin